MRYNRSTYDMKRVFKVFILILLCFCIVAGIYIFINPGLLQTELKVTVVDLSGQSFKEITSYLRDQARRNGAVYAFDVLRLAKLPPNTDLHLLGHVVGDELFKQKGIEGITHCTQDFRNACSHSIVVGLYLREKEKAFPEIAKVCKNAPGGNGAYTMCYHGLGHGILSALNYDLPKAVEFCQQTGTPEHQFYEAAECAGGAVMEIISGGDQNPELWKQESVKYFKKDDPLYPCTADFMPNNVKPLCYLYLTPHLITYAGGNLANPAPEDFKRAIRVCDTIPKTDVVARDSCFGGFGKEFIVLVHSRDIRTMVSLTDEEMKNVYEWCSYARVSDGVTACLRTAVNSLYWGGENDSSVAIRFCNVLPEGEQQACFDNLVGAAYFYNSDNERINDEFCSKLPEKYQRQCRTKKNGA